MDLISLLLLLDLAQFGLIAVLVALLIVGLCVRSPHHYRGLYGLIDWIDWFWVWHVRNPWRRGN